MLSELHIIFIRLIVYLTDDATDFNVIMKPFIYQSCIYFLFPSAAMCSTFVIYILVYNWLCTPSPCLADNITSTMPTRILFVIL